MGLKPETEAFHTLKEVKPGQEIIHDWAAEWKAQVTTIHNGFTFDLDFELSGCMLWKEMQSFFFKEEIILQIFISDKCICFKVGVSNYVIVHIPLLFW